MMLLNSRSESEPSWFAGNSLIWTRPPGRLADPVDCLLSSLVDRVHRVLTGRELVLELGRAGRVFENGDKGHGRAGREQGPAGDFVARCYFTHAVLS